MSSGLAVRARPVPTPEDEAARWVRVEPIAATGEPHLLERTPSPWLRRDPVELFLDQLVASGKEEEAFLIKQFFATRNEIRGITEFRGTGADRYAIIKDEDVRPVTDDSAPLGGLDSWDF